MSNVTSISVNAALGVLMVIMEYGCVHNVGIHNVVRKFAGARWNLLAQDRGNLFCHRDDTP